MGHLCSGRTKPFAKELLSDSEEMNGKSCLSVSKQLKMKCQSFHSQESSLAAELNDSLRDLKNSVIVSPSTKILSIKCLRVASE